jgi:hypothetical protein
VLADNTRKGFISGSDVDFYLILWLGYWFAHSLVYLLIYRSNGQNSDDINSVTFTHEGRDSGVDTATGYGLNNHKVGVRVPGAARIFSSLSRPDLLWDLFPPGVKQPGCEADHSPPTSAETKKTWVYISTPTYTFMVR